jgi:hypothetical protein
VANLETVAKGEAARVALQRLTGIEPDVSYTASQARVFWGPAKLPRMQSWVDRQFAPGAAPGDLEIDLVPPAAPFLTRLALPYAAALFVAGAALGLVFARR